MELFLALFFLVILIASITGKVADSRHGSGWH
ncbi:hypothetical protein SAMN05421748_110181 [Paractinoplanes atraurantiacus]|uniref:Uncharacterized protein n=1 Tax=Paractinoplanes atraurantiacus TaxID=1036182 RepID=A0A285IPU2_9ACTN|nr:hypothetical protein SAMN05421748_110181 [Actinoplanes atraurantiacus]